MWYLKANQRAVFQSADMLRANQRTGLNVLLCILPCPLFSFNARSSGIVTLNIIFRLFCSIIFDGLQFPQCWHEHYIQTTFVAYLMAFKLLNIGLNIAWSPTTELYCLQMCLLYLNNNIIYNTFKLAVLIYELPLILKTLLTVNALLSLVRWLDATIL